MSLERKETIQTFFSALALEVKDRFGDQDDEGSSGSSDSESDESEVVRLSEN